MSISSLNKKETLELRNSGKYPIANLKLFDSIYNLKLSDYVLESESNLKKVYNEYLSNIYDLSEQRRQIFLDSLQKEEIFKNQRIEQEDPFVIQLGLSNKKESALEYLLSRNSKINVDDIIKSHQLILMGTESEKYCRRKYRNDNLTLVSNSGNFSTGHFFNEPDISYFAIDYEEIPEALDKTVNYYNGTLHQDKFLIKPIITHGIIAGEQMFNDGNTRLARTIHNVELYNLSKMNDSLKLKKPILYMSGSYKLPNADYRIQYRKLVSDLVINEDDESWNKWIIFNLNREEDQIALNNERVKEYSKKWLL